MRIATTIGVEMAYQILPKLSVEGGLYHTTRGNKFNDLKNVIAHNIFTSDRPNEIMAVDPGSNSSVMEVGGQLGVSLHYIDVPITASYYLFKGFSVKAGVQMGFLMYAKMKGLEHFWDSGNLKDYSREIDVSIPVGISYEISKIKIDARYHWGLTRIGKKRLNKLEYKATGEIATINHIGVNKNLKNSYFTLTLGYLIAL